MATTVYSDPHLGRTMQAHTTAASRQRLTQAIFETTYNTLTAAPRGPKICAGDLFDKFQNSEQVIRQGFEVAWVSDYIMAGNHDVTADINKVGSLQLLSELVTREVGDAEFLLAPFGEAACYLKGADGRDFVFIPHHTTDGLFQQSLTDAYEWARSVKQTPRPAYLVLHCNYDSGFAVDETALSLTRKQAKWLLDGGFDYILIGHDHHPREDFDGRVIILGNMHPTGFGDITAKRVLRIEDDGSHTFVPVWSPEDHYVELTAEDLLGGAVVVPKEVQFIDISGQVAPGLVLELAKAVRQLWISCNPLAIRNRVEITKVGGEGVISHDFAAIDKVVAGELAGRPDLLALFNEYWAGTAPAVEEGE